MRILVVDDDRALRETLAIGLRAAGHESLAAGDGRSALQACQEDRPDLVVLDLGLPDLPGTEVLRRLRAWTALPVIVLSARSGSADKVEALDLGADDYVTKPFGLDELLARIRATGRRAGVDQPRLELDGLVVDFAERTAVVADRSVKLTPTEWALLGVLVRESPKPVAAADLLTEVWGPHFARQSHYVRVYVAALRKKLEADPTAPARLLTEPGIGYRFVP